MSKVALSLAFLFCWFPCRTFAQDCALSGTTAWSKEVRNVIADCDNRFPSPNGKLLLRIDSNGNVRLSEVASGSELQGQALKVEPPAMVSWSPNSDAFFVNDGEGSGMSSTFRLFRVRGNQVVEDRRIERGPVALYRRQTKCGSAAADPNVWGIGWSPDGARFHLLVQATVNAPCGEPGSFVGMTMRLADGIVLARFSEQATKRKFRALLPREVLSK
jgi:WD40 repeat protein